MRIQQRLRSTHSAFPYNQEKQKHKFLASSCMQDTHTSFFSFICHEKISLGKEMLRGAFWEYVCSRMIPLLSFWGLYPPLPPISGLWPKKSQTDRQYLASKTPMPFQRQRGGGEEQWKCLLLPLHSFPTKSPPKRLFKKRILLLLPGDVLRQIWQMALDPTPSLL